jgi:uncharacterized protein (DUF488 family)
MRVFTIGFTKISAEEFFTKLKDAGVKRLIDVRLYNVSQLAGFAKKEDLRYFLRAICRIEYEYNLLLAPTKELLETYKKQKGDWSTYETRFLELMAARKIENVVSKESLQDACLLCSEHEPSHCHRRLVVEYLQNYWNDLEIVHLV